VFSRAGCSVGDAGHTRLKMKPGADNFLLEHYSIRYAKPCLAPLALPILEARLALIAFKKTQSR